MKQIPLTQGQFALVDDDDFEWLNSLGKWQAQYDPKMQSFYARHGEYIRGAKKYKVIHMHRILLNAEPGQLVDHENHNTLDNRRCNIRIVTSRQNQYNSKKRIDAKTSIYKGVCWHTRDKKWRAQIEINGINKYIGSFNTEKEAVEAYDSWAIACAPEHALTNEKIGFCALTFPKLHYSVDRPSTIFE